MMTSSADPPTLWLSLTNITLGVLCVALLLMVVTAVAYDVRERRKERRRRRSLWCVLRNDRPHQAAPRPPMAG